MHVTSLATAITRPLTVSHSPGEDGLVVDPVVAVVVSPVPMVRGEGPGGDVLVGVAEWEGEESDQLGSNL